MCFSIPILYYQSGVAAPHCVAFVMLNVIYYSSFLVYFSIQQRICFCVESWMIANPWMRSVHGWFWVSYSFLDAYSVKLASPVSAIRVDVYLPFFDNICSLRGMGFFPTNFSMAMALLCFNSMFYCELGLREMSLMHGRKLTQ